MATTAEINSNITATPISTIAEYVKLWGNSASVGLFDPSCKFFNTPNIDGIIGYRSASRSVIVTGDPLCAEKDLPQLVQAFHKHCQDQNKNIVFILSSEKFAKWAVTHAQDTFKAYIQIGEELYLDPMDSPLDGAKGRKLRNKISHAKRDGVTAHEHDNYNPEIELAMSQVAQQWVNGRSGPQLFLADVDLFSERVGKRWFYVKLHDRIVGVLLLNRLEARQGWLVNLMMTAPDVPWGTSELLAAHALEVLRQEKCGFVSFGVVTGKNLGETAGLNLISRNVAYWAYHLTNRFYDLAGRKIYWKKFTPQSEKSYFVFETPKVSPLGIMDILKAMKATL